VVSFPNYLSLDILKVKKGVFINLVEDVKTLKVNTLETILMVLRKCDFSYEERECEKYEPDAFRKYALMRT
jgi:hypothetical protein